MNDTECQASSSYTVTVSRLIGLVAHDVVVVDVFERGTTVSRIQGKEEA